MSPDFIKRKILLPGDASGGEGAPTRGSRVVALSMMIWDVLGKKGYKGIQESAFRGARGVILVFDLTRPETKASFEEYWVPRVRGVAGSVPMIVVGNKVDLVEDREDALRAVAELGKKHGTPA